MDVESLAGWIIIIGFTLFGILQIREFEKRERQHLWRHRRVNKLPPDNE